MRTIEEIRHANLLLVLDELAATAGERGAVQRLADRMQRSHSQVSQLKTKATHSKTGKPRNIGSAIARQIEAAADKPRGWLDVPHEQQLEESIDDRISRIVDVALAKRTGKLHLASSKPADRGDPRGSSTGATRSTSAARKGTAGGSNQDH